MKVINQLIVNQFEKAEEICKCEIFINIQFFSQKIVLSIVGNSQ